MQPVELSWVDRLVHRLTRPPYHDEIGHKGWFEPISRAPPHVVRQLSLTIEGWPRWRRPLRIAFLSDFHCGSHAQDVARLLALVTEAATWQADLVLFGGDFVNMQPFGGGRIAPHTIAAILSKLHSPLGAYAVLGNHDYYYGPGDVSEALRGHGIAVLSDGQRALEFEGEPFNLLGIPDAHNVRASAKAALTARQPNYPTIVLAHDPVWFAHLPAGPHLMLAGHTHGGQICVAGRAFYNSSRAPLRWSYGLIQEDGRRMYVTSGIGTSGVPLRVGIPPEIVLLELSGGRPTSGCGYSTGSGSSATSNVNP